MNVVPALKEDLPAILELQKLCYLQEAEMYNDNTIQPLQEHLEDLELAFSQGTVFLKMIKNNAIIGSVRAYETEGTCYIGKLIVHPEHQNQGYGKSLLNTIETLFFKSERFELFTGHKSHKNLYLYTKLGYKEFERVAVHEGLELIFLEKNTLLF